MRSRLPTLALLPLLLGATCATPFHVASRSTRTITHALPLPSTVRRIEVQFHDGLLTLEPAAAIDCSLAIDLVADDDLALGRLAMRVAPTTELDAGSRTAKLQVALPAGAAMDAVRTTWRLQVPADVTVAVKTRLGGIVARDTAANLEVEAGSGVVDVQMAGGSAQLATNSGSLMLRGDYPFADLRSELGRIDLRLPNGGDAQTDVRVHAGKGDLYLDLPDAQQYEVCFAGDQHLVYCEPEVRVDWQMNVALDGEDYVAGRIGDLRGPVRGRLRIDARGPVHVRRLPAAGG